MRLAMSGALAQCLLLSYRTPADSVRGLLPAGLELVTRGPWAFWNVVACRVEGLRPALPRGPRSNAPGPPNPAAGSCSRRRRPAPPGPGISYHHVAYRLLVQAMTDRADLRRGLYFVRSDVDSAAVAMLGGRLTDLRPHRATIDFHARQNRLSVEVAGSGGRQAKGRAKDADGVNGRALIRAEHGPPRRPRDSCFANLAAARAFLHYPPLGLAVERRDAPAHDALADNAPRRPSSSRVCRRRPGGKGGAWLKLTRVRREEAHWRQTMVTVTEARLDFLDSLGQHDAKLELATRIAPIAYHWELGERERLLGGAGGVLQDRPMPRRQETGVSGGRDAASIPRARRTAGMVH